MNIDMNTASADKGSTASMPLVFLFTKGQKARVYAVFSVGGERAELYENLTQ